MDRGEFDNGIMTSIRFEQRNTLAKAIVEIARLRQASREPTVPTWNSPESLPGGSKQESHYQKLDFFCTAHCNDNTHANKRRGDEI